MNEEKEPVFTDPEKWRFELYRQHTPSIINTYEQNKTEDEVGIFLLDLEDPIASKLAHLLIKDLETNENIATIIVKIETFLQYVEVLSAQKSAGFQIGVLFYIEETEVPVCVIAANGATFFAVQNLK